MLVYISYELDNHVNIVNGGKLFFDNIYNRLCEHNNLNCIKVFINVAPTDETNNNLSCDANGNYAMRLNTNYIKRNTRNFLKQGFYIPFEGEARINKKQLTKKLGIIVKEKKIDTIIMAYLYTALFVEYADIPCKVLMITCNDEAAFYKENMSVMINKMNNPLKRISSKISAFICNRKLINFEMKCYNEMNRVVTISENDIPVYLPHEKVSVITLYLNDKEKMWTYNKNKIVFFIGSYAHYPNKLAIDYMIEHVVPQVNELMVNVKFMFLGVAPSQIDKSLHKANVTFLGTGNKSDAERLFTEGSLLFCPVKNMFGQKMKIAEALSYRTPFLASQETMYGYPYLRNLPYAPLEDSSQSAKMIVEYLGDPAKLQQLSKQAHDLHSTFIKTQCNVWYNIIAGKN